MEVTPLVVLPRRHPSYFNQKFGVRSSYPTYSLSSRNKNPYLHSNLYQDKTKLQQQQRLFFSVLSLASLFKNKGTVRYTTFKTGKMNSNELLYCVIVICICDYISFQIFFPKTTSGKVLFISSSF